MCFFKQKGQEAVLGLPPMARLKLPQSSAPVRWNHAGHFPVERLRWYRCSVDRRAQDRKRPSELLQKKDKKGWVWMTCPSLVKPNYAHPNIDSIDQLGCVWKCFVWPPLKLLASEPPYPHVFLHRIYGPAMPMNSPNRPGIWKWLNMTYSNIPNIYNIYMESELVVS